MFLHEIIVIYFQDCLDRLADDLDADDTFIRDVVFDVFIGVDSFGFADANDAQHARDAAPESKVQAEMTVSIWILNSVRYFTIAFGAFSATSKDESKSNIQQSSRSQDDPKSHKLPSLQSESPLCSKCGLSIASAIEPSVGDAQIVSSDTFSSITQPLTDMEKLIIMQDRLIDAMEVPVMAMWKDESVATINKALSRLMYPGAECGHGADVPAVPEILSSFKVYTEDFQRELSMDEYPIVIACRSRNPNLKYRFGLIASTGRKRLFEGTVDQIHDENNEFQAVLTVLKDVTWYTDQIKAQDEQSERQFELICETLPQMVCMFSVCTPCEINSVADHQSKAMDSKR